jgi:hypothetical protein
VEVAAPTLYRNTSIKALDMSYSWLVSTESAEILRGVFRSNKTMTALNLSGNEFGQTTRAVDYIADGLGSKSTLLKIDIQAAPWEMAVSPLWRKLSALGTRSYRNSHSVRIALHLRVLVWFSKRWNRAATTSRI